MNEQYKWYYKQYECQSDKVIWLFLGDMNAIVCR